MSQDKNMRARVDGRMKVAQRTVWTLDLGAMAARCLQVEGGGYVVQGKVEGRWSVEIGRGPNALDLLRKVANSKGITCLLDGNPDTCGANVDRRLGGVTTLLVCALRAKHGGDHNTAADGSGDSFVNRRG